jgi:transcriptional regulator with XRE-family HTH domain
VTSETAPKFSPTRLRDARLAADMSRFDLAVAIRKSEKNIGRWERGEHEPRGETVARIAGATGKEIGFFYVEGEGDEEDAEAARGSSALASLETALTDLARDAVKRATREGVHS